MRIPVGARDRLRVLAETYGQSMSKMIDCLSWTTTDEVLPLHARRVAAQLRATPAQGA